MKKLHELSTVLDELRSIEAALHTATNTLAALLSENDDTPADPGTATPVTLEQVRAVLAEKSVQGHTAEVQTLIHQQGVKKLSQVDPAQYANLLAEAEAL